MSIPTINTVWNNLSHPTNFNLTQMVGEICEDRKKSIFVERGKREKLKYSTWSTSVSVSDDDDDDDDDDDERTK